MAKNNLNMSDDEFDRALDAAEDSVEARALKALGHNTPIRPEFITHLEAELKESAGSSRGFALPRLSWPARRAIRIAAALALVVLVGGLVWLNQPTRVSAQEVLQKAAAAKLEANQIVHRTYVMSPTGSEPYTGGAEMWIESDASGEVARSSVTITELGEDGNPATIIRDVYDGSQFQLYQYDVPNNAVFTKSGEFSSKSGTERGPNFFDGSNVAEYIQSLSEQGGESGDLNKKVHLLPTQEFHGAQVIGLRIGPEGPKQQAFYFDAESYVLRGFQFDGQEAWLESEAVVDPANVPEDAFAFVLPEGATVDQPSDDPKKASGDVPRNEEDSPFDPVLETVCGLSKDDVNAAMESGQSILAACQANDPSITEDQLVEALLEPIREKINAEVAAGYISQDDLPEVLEQSRQKLVYWLRMPPEGKPESEPEDK